MKHIRFHDPFFHGPFWSSLCVNHIFLDPFLEPSKEMPHCKPLQILWLVGACLSTWAAPLGSLPQEKCCESKDTTDHLASREKMCATLSLQVPLCLRVEIPERTRHAEEVAVTDPVIGHLRQVKLVERSVKAYTQYQSTDESSADEKMKENPISVTSSESVTVADRAMGHENAEQKAAAQMLQPFQLSSNRPAQTDVTLDHSKYSSLHHSNVDESTRSVYLPSPEEDRGRKVLTIKKNTSAGVNSKRGREISTESLFMIPSSTHDSVSQSPWTVSLAFTALTTLGSHDGQSRRATADKKSIAEENPYTDTENQDKALVPGLLKPDLSLNSKLAELSGAWAESVQLQGVDGVSELPLSQEVGTEATMSSEHLPLIFEPTDDITTSRSSVLAPELSVLMMPTTGMLEEAELEQSPSMDTDHTPHDVSLPGPSDWPSPWHMSGAETFDAAIPSQNPVSRPLSKADQEHLGRIERLQNSDVIPTSVGAVGLSGLPDAATAQNVLQNKSAHSAMLKPMSGLEELESEENEDEEDEDMDESEEEDEEEDESKEETETHEHSQTHPPYSLIPPPVWGQRNQGLVRSWVELIREKAGYVSGMLAPVGIGIAGALFIVGALYGIRMIHRKRKNNLKHQRRKQPTEVRQGPDHAMLLADSSEDEL